MKRSAKTQRCTIIAVTLLAFFSIVWPVATNAFCLIAADETVCSDRCTAEEECGRTQDVATGHCTQIEGPVISGLVCVDDPDLTQEAALVEANSQRVKPDLTVEIPGVSFLDFRTTKTADGLYLETDIPWLADYIVGVYRYAIFFGSILSLIMIILSGLQWLTAGGDAGRVGAAQKRITNAVVGLLLLLGSFLVLSTINPNLTMLNPLHIKMVNPQRFNVKEVLQTTTEDTGNPLEMP
ncbi:hypothetical protein KKE28_01040 [Patescibacteria group bacterium]|nr:hypothetical protein [Patescibacteria group bacterium]MBU1916244.1 hypothetical protein [Patescibacteria group bacterium]